MMIIYDISNGKINAIIPKEQPYHYLEGNNSHLIIENIPANWRDFKVVDGELVKLNNLEINDIKHYGRILPDEERQEITLLRKLSPTREEVLKAENTIDILNLIQEVM